MDHFGTDLTHGRLSNGKNRAINETVFGAINDSINKMAPKIPKRLTVGCFPNQFLEKEIEVITKLSICALE